MESTTWRGQLSAFPLVFSCSFFSCSFPGFLQLFVFLILHAQARFFLSQIQGSCLTDWATPYLKGEKKGQLFHKPVVIFRGMGSTIPFPAEERNVFAVSKITYDPLASLCLLSFISILKFFNFIVTSLFDCRELCRVFENWVVYNF